MRSNNPIQLPWEADDRRALLRFPVAVPATLLFGGDRHCARLINIACTGAKLETRAPLKLSSVVELRCGTIAIRASVAWQSEIHIGLRFVGSLSESQVTEQVARSLAIAQRRSGGTIQRSHEE